MGEKGSTRVRALPRCCLRARLWGPRRRAACEHRRPSLVSNPRGHQDTWDYATANSGYTGHQRDPDLGLINMRGRLFDSRLSRFTQADPFVMEPFNPQGFNRFAYVRNNPLNWVDPSGFYEVGQECGTYGCGTGPNDGGGWGSGRGDTTTITVAIPPPPTPAPEPDAGRSKGGPSANQTGAASEQQAKADAARGQTQANDKASQQIAASAAQANESAAQHTGASTSAANVSGARITQQATGDGLHFGPPVGPDRSRYLADNAGGDERFCNGAFCSYDENGNIRFNNIPLLAAVGDLIRAGAAGVVVECIIDVVRSLKTDVA